MRSQRGIVILAAVAAAMGGSHGLFAQSFAENTQVTLVEVPVQVVRETEPVRGLTAADFQIFEGKIERPITGFDVVDLGKPETRLLSASLPSAGIRHILLLFDLANSDPKAIIRAQQAISDSLVKTLTPSDLVAVAVYSQAEGLRLALGFTSDIRQILFAVKSLGYGTVGHTQSNASLVAGEAAIADMMGDMSQPLTPPDTTGMTTLERGRAIAGYALAQAFQTVGMSLLSQAQSELLQAQRTNLAEQRNVISALARAFTDLANMMSAVSGRKLVIYFSEGFDSTILHGSEDLYEQADMADESTHYGGFAGIEDQERFGDVHQGTQMDHLFDQLRRADCAIEAVDIAGLRGQDLDTGAGKRTNGEAALVQMARDTGGDVFRNSNDLGDSLNRLMNQTSVTYVLSFQPDIKADGAYRPIRVVLSKAQRGTRVVSRTGYYAPRPYAQQTPIARRMAAADQLMTANNAGSIPTAVLVAPFRGATPKAYVPVIVEAESTQLLAGNSGTSLPVEVYVHAVDNTGLVRDFFEQHFQLDIEKAGLPLRQGGLKFVGHLELPAGEYSVRVLLRSSLTGAFGKRAVVVSVPAYATAPVLLPPMFPEPSGRWAIVRENPRGGQKDTPYPFVAAGQAFVPASQPTLVIGSPVAMAVLGYNLGAESTASAKLLSADGQHEVGSCPVRLGVLVPGGAEHPDLFKASLQLPADLAAGSYQLLLNVSGTAGSDSRAAVIHVGGGRPGGGTGL